MTIRNQLMLLNNSNSYHEFILNTSLQGISKAKAHKILTNAVTSYPNRRTMKRNAYVTGVLRKKAFHFMKEAYHHREMPLKTIFKNIEYLI